MLLPILPVERFDNQFDWIRLQTSYINIVPVGIRSRDVERFDSAERAEAMPGHARVERVGGETLLAAQQLEAGFWDDEMKVSRFRADRTVAVTAFEFLRRLNFEPHGLAMTTTLIDHRLPALDLALSPRGRSNRSLAHDNLPLLIQNQEISGALLSTAWCFGR